MTHSFYFSPMQRILWILFLVFTSISSGAQQEKWIAISWYYPNQAYQHWLLEADSTLHFVNIYTLPDDSIDYYLNLADGYVLTGGTDISASVYDTLDPFFHCKDVDPRRDSLETLMVHKAFAKWVPVLGVCRGMQIMNVALGGTLVLDLPEQRNTRIHQVSGKDMEHDVYVLEGAWFAPHFEADTFLVRSNHHQAIDLLAEGFEVQAVAEDGIIEAIWWEGPEPHPFALGLQWHPERMDPHSPGSADVRLAFLDAVRKHD